MVNKNLSQRYKSRYGNRLKYVLHNIYHTRVWLANGTGVSIKHIQKILDGEIYPSEALAKRINRCFNKYYKTQSWKAEKIDLRGY